MLIPLPIGIGKKSWERDAKRTNDKAAGSEENADLKCRRTRQKLITKLERIRSYELQYKTTMTLVLVPTLFHKEGLMESGRQLKQIPRTPLTQVKNFMINLTSKSHLVTKKYLSL